MNNVKPANFFAILLILVAILYAITCHVPPSVSGQEINFFREMWVASLNGVVSTGLFGLLVWFFSKSYEENQASAELKIKIEILRNTVKRMFMRMPSEWNFGNMTPSFYFDNSYINPLYDIVRKSEDLIVRHQTLNNNSIADPFLKELDEFVLKYDLASINCEKIDQYIQKLTDAGLAAIKDDPNAVAKKQADDEAWYGSQITRACFAGIPSNPDALFRIARHVNAGMLITSSLAKIESKYKEVNAEREEKGKYGDINKEIDRLKDNRTELLSIIEKIKVILKG